MKLKNWIFLVFVVFNPLSVLSQQVPYYVVIGAFAKEENAKRYVDKALDLNIPAVYSFTSDKKLYYVYVRQSSDLGKAQHSLQSVRREGFDHAWIFRGFLEGSPLEENSQTGIATAANTQAESEQEPVFEETASHFSQQTPETLAVEAPPVVTESKDAAPVGKPFVFQLLNGITGAPVTGLVRLQETEKSNQYHGHSGNEKVYVGPPANRSGRWLIVGHVVGFKPFKKQLNYTKPQLAKDIKIGENQEVIVPLPLVRVRKGDYMEMEEVKFVTDSDILLPESERELKELLAMLQENPDYRIRIHGHANGDHAREITSLGESSNFFSSDSANTRNSGSAKELSTLRATVVKKYLVHNGVDGRRIAIRGEGGKQMIFDPKGTHASGNDRVEVEITRH